MPTAAKNILFILLIPFLLSLGHDLYLNYVSNSPRAEQIKSLRVAPNALIVSDAGWIWQEYAGNSMRAAKDLMGTNRWEQNIDPILKKPTMSLTIIPFAIGLVYVSITFIFVLWPFSKDNRRVKHKPSVYKNSEGKKVKYKKK